MTNANGQRTPFANNRIPSDRLDPVAVALLAKIPLPNQPGNVQNLISAIKESTDMNQFTLRSIIIYRAGITSSSG